MLSSSFSSIVKKTRGSLSREEEGSKESSNSFTFYKKRPNSKNETPIDPSHDQNWTPVHIIQSEEDLDAEEDFSGSKEGREDSVQETDPNCSEKITHDPITTLDEATVSARGAFQYAPSKPLLIDTAKGDVLLGSDEKDSDPGDDTLDQLRVQAEKFLEDQKRKTAELLERLESNTSIPKDSPDLLSLDVDESILGSSTLDEALGSFKEDGQGKELCSGCATHDNSLADFVKSEPTLVKELFESCDPMCSKHVESDYDASSDMAHETKNVKIESEIQLKRSNHEDFCQETFANIGKVISNENERCINKPNSSVSCDEEPSIGSRKGETSFSYLTISCIILASVALYISLSGGRDEADTALMTNIDEEEIIEEITMDHNVCPEESFHYAMYHLSNVADKQDAQFQTDMPPTFRMSALVNIMFRGLLLFEIVQYSRYALGGGKHHNTTSSSTNSKEHWKRTKSPPTKPKLQREMNSLEKRNIFVSSFVTDIVSPKDGTIESVKRSARIKSTSSVQVDLLAEFDDAPMKNIVGYKSVKTE